jgi:hypothetical protein
MKETMLQPQSRCKYLKHRNAAGGSQEQAPHGIAWSSIELQNSEGLEVYVVVHNTITQLITRRSSNTVIGPCRALYGHSHLLIHETELVSSVHHALLRSCA